MLSRFRYAPRSFVLLAGSMMLALLLVACGGGTTSTSTPTPTPTPIPSPSPTSATSSTTYNGNSYTISYPAGWKVNPAGTSVTFADPTGIYNMTIVVAPNPEGIASANTVASAGITGAKSRLKNPVDENVPATTSVGGDSWVQKSTSGASTAEGQNVVLQFVVIADNHPASSPSTNSFTIVYGTAQALFQTASSTYFQPMLQSFKFSS